jgi:hypothetical protein
MSGKAKPAAFRIRGKWSLMMFCDAGGGSGAACGIKGRIASFSLVLDAKESQKFISNF